MLTEGIYAVKVYIVCEFTYDHHEIVKVFKDEAAAEVCCNELIAGSVIYDYMIEVWEVF